MKKYWVMAALFCILMGAATAGGMYIGALVYKQWLGLTSEPSVTMLYAYWQRFDDLPVKMIFPLKASPAVAAFLPIAALVLI